MPGSPTWRVWLLLWLAGTATRLTILAVPPVITAIQSDLGLSGTQVGILSGLPVVLFAAFALPGSMLIARVGVVAAMVVGLLVTALGASLRSAFPAVAVLYVGTVVMGAGVAMLHVALPAAVRAWTPQRLGFATALYTNGLLVGEIVPVALTGFLLPLVGESWRWTLAIWGMPLFVYAMLVLLLSPKTRLAAGGAAARWWPDWSDPVLWRLGFVFASITATYFGANAFLPAHLSQSGRTDLIPAALTALNAGQIPASFILLLIAGRFAGRAPPLIVIGVLSVAATLGLALTASYWSVALAGLLGFILAAALTFGLTLPAFLSAPEDMARLTAGMFTISYMTSVAISILGGAAWDASGWPGAALIVVAVGALPLVLLPAGLPLRGPRAVS